MHPWGAQGDEQVNKGKNPLGTKEQKLSSKSKFDTPQHTQPLGAVRFKPSVRFISLED